MALYNDGIDRAFTGVRILDFTHVQAGPTLTQLFAFWGADCIKVERPGVGDITRAQLRDIPGKDSLYFTMLNGTKRSITLDTKIGMGNEVLTDLIKACDVIAENFGPGVLDRMGFTWERIQEINPRIIYASVKGFGEGPFQDCKVYENIAQCAGGGASTTGDVYGPPTVSGPQVGDSGTGLHVAFGIAAALYQRTKTGRGQRVQCSMQDSVINLCRVKYRDQQRLTNTGGPLNEYPQFYLNIPFGKAVPRAGNASGGGQPGWVLKCKGWETDPDAYTYFITQAQVWPAVCDLLGKPEWKETYKTPDSRLPQLKMIFDTIEQWTMQRTKYEVMDACNKVDIPVGPILSCKEVLEDESLYKTGTFVRVNHPDRGEFVTVGNPIKLSDSPQIVLPSPALGQHTEEVLAEVLGYNADKVSAVVGSGCTKPAPKK